MCKKSMTLCLVMLLALASLAQAASIIWISDNKGYGDVEPNTPADQGWVDVLETQGHEVIYVDRDNTEDGTQRYRTLDPNKIAELEAADLIIVSRNADSGSYASVADNEPNQWNAITTPILNLNGYMARSNKWGWLNTTATVRAKDSLMAVVADSPILAGVTADANNQIAAITDGNNVDWADSNDAGNGTLVALTNDQVSIAIWEAGQAYFEGGSAVAGGPRMLFVAGTGSKNSVPDGMYNLTPAGEQLFLNAVNYLLPGSASVVWVTGTADSDEDGIQDDMSWVNWLGGNGYDVDVRPDYWTGTVDANKIAELEAADLVMISRRISSGDPQKETFNPITTPIINLNAWTLRTSRMKWLNSGTALKYNGAPMLMLSTEAESHPIFDGVEGSVLEILDPNVGAGEVSLGNTSFVDITDAGNGTVLGTALGDIMGQVFIAEWDAGVEYYEGSGEFAGGPRIAFMAGTQDRNDDAPDQTIPPTSGVFNLNETGAQIMSNAIAYLIDITVQDPGTDNLVAYYPLDGDANDASGNGLDGVIAGDPTFVVDGGNMGLQLDGVDDYVDCGNDPLLDLTDEITVSTWVKVNDFGNGENDPWVSKGDKSWALKGHRNGYAIEFFVYESGWKWIDVEVDDINNEWHHAAGSFDGEKLRIYLDGEKVAEKASTPGIASTSYGVAIGGNLEKTDRYSEGIHDEIMIYNKALTAGEVAYIAGQ